MMPQKLTRNHKQIAGKMSSQNVLKARDYRGEGHCDKKKVSGRILQEGNKNSNNFQHVERGDDDEESVYLMSQKNKKGKKILNEILKNDMISSESKRSCSNKLFEATKKVELEKSDDTLSLKMSNQKDSLPENKEKHRKKQILNLFNTNVNSSSRRSQNSKKNFRTSTSKPGNVFRFELGFNNNAEGGLRTSSKLRKPSGETRFPFENTEEFLANFLKQAEIEVKEKAEEIKRAKIEYEKLRLEKRAVARDAIERAIAFEGRIGPSANVLCKRFLLQISDYFGLERYNVHGSSIDHISLIACLHEDDWKHFMPDIDELEDEVFEPPELFGLY